MPNALVTICAPVERDRIDEARTLIATMQNPARPDIAAALDRLDGEEGIHFASLHVIPDAEPRADHGQLVLEFSADGTDDPAIRRLVARIGSELEAVFSIAANWRGGELASYLQAQVVRIGQGWIGQPGLAFAGTPEITVGRIRREAALAEWLTNKLGAQGAGIRPLHRLAKLRAGLREEPHLRWALETPGAPLPDSGERGMLAAIGPLVGSFLATYLWPLAIPLLVLLSLGLWHGIAGLRDALAGAESLSVQLWLLISAVWSGVVWLGWKPFSRRFANPASKPPMNAPTRRRQCASIPGITGPCSPR